VRRVFEVLVPISIHALREESDSCGKRSQYKDGIFLSTLSVRRATRKTAENPSKNTKISIHALREESDIPLLIMPVKISEFLSTLSVRRATLWSVLEQIGTIISIHALREESDYDRESPVPAVHYFYPRSP